jgi:precorrin-6B methylase 2
MTNLKHLNELFAASEDPWHRRSGWYEVRKRSILLSVLDEPRYSSAFEPGCGSGSLTEMLATRCDRLLSMESAREAMAETASRTAHLSNVTVRHGWLPDDWPRHETFDLVVLHEIGLSHEPAAWAEVAESVVGSLSSTATVVACHWKHYRAKQHLAAETVHGVLNSILGLNRQTKIADCDFILDVWATADRTVAQRDGLV